MKKNTKNRVIALVCLLLSCLLAAGLLSGCSISLDLSSAKSAAKDLIQDVTDKIGDAVGEIKEQVDNGEGGSIQINEIIESIGTGKEEASSGVSELPASGDPNQVRYYFRNKNLLEEHYRKHGIEMGFSSPEQYEAAASAVINNPKALSKTEEEDGDLVYYVEDTNEFVVLSTDGYIRTYFYPSAGKDYYDRQ